MQALTWLYFCSEFPSHVRNEMALFLLGNPTLIYVSNKMALLLHGNPTMVNARIKMVILGRIFLQKH